MNRKALTVMLAALATAIFILPSSASATPWHISTTGPFTIASNGSARISFTSSLYVECTSITGSGNYETTTTGKLQLSFNGCRFPFGSPCPYSTTELPFHNVMLASGQAGLLITPSSVTNSPTFGQGHVANFPCVGISISGNGLLVRLPSPACGEATSTMTLSFASKEWGHQVDSTYTGTVYSFQGNFGGSHVGTAIDATTTISFPEAKTKTCTL